MKKVFFLLTAAVMAIMFSSCNQNEPEQSGDFIITVSNITKTSADYKIVPKDTEATYVVTIFHKSDISSKTDDQVRVDMKNAMDVSIKYVTDITGYDYFLRTGNKEGTITNLQPGTTTSIAVSKMDVNGTFSGILSRKIFRTME